MAKIVKSGNTTYWLDGEGNKVPERVIDPVLKERDKFVEHWVEKARKMQEVLSQFKSEAETALANFLSDSAAREGEKWEGGTTLANFSMDESITIKVRKIWAFDERLQIAKQKIDKVIEARSAGADDLVLALVNRAFSVNSKGEVDARQMMQLRSIEVNDPLWQEAMKLVADSQKVGSTKTYFYFQEHAEDGSTVNITLDFASL